jgi:hypothetical protein
LESFPEVLLASEIIQKHFIQPFLVAGLFCFSRAAETERTIYLISRSWKKSKTTSRMRQNSTLAISFQAGLSSRANLTPLYP